ncbi:MAG: SAM-dependent methyltransferase, partial [Thiogranum sp.]
MMNESYSPVVKTAQDYYNSDDADNFYYHVWGGEDIHIGIYESFEDDIADASKRTVDAMAAQCLMNLAPQTQVLDVGAGYGGAARWLAENFGCHVTCLNLSEAQ